MFAVVGSCYSSACAAVADIFTSNSPTFSFDLQNEYTHLFQRLYVSNDRGVVVGACSEEIVES